MRLTETQREVLGLISRRPHGMVSARIYGGEVIAHNFVCRRRTLDALKSKALVCIQHESMSNYWITATAAGLKAVDAIR